MAEPGIVWTRIDNRLVHGQVGNAWVGATGANLVIVADDMAATDKVQQQLMKMTAESAGCEIKFFTLEHTIDVFSRKTPKKSILMVVHDPAAARKLIEGGVPIKSVNVGNMHPGAGKEVYHETHVYADAADVADLDAIKAAGVELFIQIQPTDHKYDL